MTKRKDGRWQERYFEPGMDKPKYFYSSELNQRKAMLDISNQIAEYSEKLHQGRHNFLIICQSAIEDKEQEGVKYKTIESYNNALAKLSSLYDYDIEDITPEMIEGIFYDMFSKKYSYSSIHKVKILCGIAYKYGLRRGLKINNFISAVPIPKKAPKGKVHSPNKKVINYIKNNAESSDFGLWCLFLYATGARMGEANAIQKKDINFSKKEIHIHKVTEFKSNQPIIRYETKTESGKRSVPLLDILYGPLKRRCDMLEAEDYIFGGKSPLSKCAIRKRLDKFKKHCGEDFTNHQLRHEYAKTLWLAGVDPKTAQGLMGHSSIEVTLDIYTDFDKSMNVKAAEKINSLLN